MLLRDLINATALKQLFSSKLPRVRKAPFVHWALLPSHSGEVGLKTLYSQASNETPKERV